MHFGFTKNDFFMFAHLKGVSEQVDKLMEYLKITK